MADEITADGVAPEAEGTTAPEAPSNSTESKQDIPAEVKNALKKANKEAETLRLKLKEYEDRDKTDLQRLHEERDTLKSERDSLNLKTLQREVADEKGLTAAQARRLVGSTREELEADADDILSAFPAAPAKPKFGDVGQGARGESAQRIYSRSELNDFTFYQANKADIALAYKEGRIADE